VQEDDNRAGREKGIAMGEMITVDSQRLYLARPAGGRGPGVLVLHAWWGLTPVFTRVCDRLAEAGFIALAPDLYHGETATNRKEAARLCQALDGDRALGEVKEAIGILSAQPGFVGPGVGAIAFSLGGWFALSLGENVRAVVLYYSGSDVTDVKVNAPIQGHFADDDEFEPREQVEQFRDRLLAEGRRVDFHFYSGTRHWFFEENQAGYYDAGAAGKSWERTVAFLRESLAPTDA
jgi:carboxymethylenebutenolidase